MYTTKKKVFTIKLSTFVFLITLLFLGNNSGWTNNKKMMLASFVSIGVLTYAICKVYKHTKEKKLDKKMKRLFKEIKEKDINDNIKEHLPMIYAFINHELQIFSKDPTKRREEEESKNFNPYLTHQKELIEKIASKNDNAPNNENIKDANDDNNNDVQNFKEIKEDIEKNYRIELDKKINCDSNFFAYFMLEMKKNILQNDDSFIYKHTNWEYEKLQQQLKNGKPEKNDFKEASNLLSLKSLLLHDDDDDTFKKSLKDTELEEEGIKFLEKWRNRMKKYRKK